ncbi:MAG: sugar transferase [Chloroflexi bacterium]|nr:sugar transferase [Chloroflexota bacterium]
MCADSGETIRATEGPPPGLAPRARRPLKRALDLVAAGTLLLLSSPLFAAIALAMWLEGALDPRARGPLLYREVRLDRGRPFQFLKFRTFDRAIQQRLDRGDDFDQWVREDLAHRTRVGHYLKKWYLDELPQLINVLRGDISLVGTRPYTPKDCQRRVEAGLYHKVYVPAGLTGLVQVHKGRLDQFPEPLLEDEYWKRYCTLSDWQLLRFELDLLWRTARTMLEGQGL